MNGTHPQQGSAAAPSAAIVPYQSLADQQDKLEEGQQITAADMTKFHQLFVEAQDVKLDDKETEKFRQEFTGLMAQVQKSEKKLGKRKAWIFVPQLLGAGTISKATSLGMTGTLDMKDEKVFGNETFIGSAAASAATGIVFFGLTALVLLECFNAKEQQAIANVFKEKVGIDLQDALRHADKIKGIVGEKNFAEHEEALREFVTELSPKERRGQLARFLTDGFIIFTAFPFLAVKLSQTDINEHWQNFLTPLILTAGLGLLGVPLKLNIPPTLKMQVLVAFIATAEIALAAEWVIKHYDIQDPKVQMTVRASAAAIGAAGAVLGALDQHYLDGKVSAVINYPFRKAYGGIGMALNWMRGSQSGKLVPAADAGAPSASTALLPASASETPVAKL